MATDNLLLLLEQLRDLIDTSIESLKENAHEFGGKPISLDSLELHPIHQSTNYEVKKALKTMSSAAHMLRATVDPHVCLNDIFMGSHDGTSLLVCIEANVANILGDKEMHVRDISSISGIEGDKLSRYLRNLCNSHVFRETAPDVFANNTLSSVLRDEGKSAYMAICLDIVRKSSVKAWEALTHPDFKNSDAPNKAPFNIAYNTPLKVFKYISEVEPEIGKRTKIGFASGTKVNEEEYLSLYPWSREKSKKVVDVGGGIGGGMFPVYKEFQDFRLVVQDIADSGPGFDTLWNEEFPAAVADGRVSFQAYDFFQPQPEAADIYFMRYIIHDWPDAEAVKILLNTASKMTQSTRLLICEQIIFPIYRLPSIGTSSKSDEFNLDAPEPLPANWGNADTSRLDLQVLATLNARERTQGQYVALLQQSGLEVVKFWRNLGPMTIIETRKR